MENKKELTLQEAISAIQADTSIFLEKNAKNTYGNYDYYTESQVLNHVKNKACQAYGVSVVIKKNPATPSLIEYNPSAKKWIYKAEGLLILSKGKEQEVIDIDLVGDNTDAPKAMGSALTYAMKYWLAKLFLLPTDNLDPDHDKQSKPVKQEPVKQEPKNWRELAKIDKELVKKYLVKYNVPKGGNLTEEQEAELFAEWKGTSK